MAIKAAILTVSDSVSNNTATDRSGPALEKLLKNSGSFDIVATAVVPDDLDLIRKNVREWAEQVDGPALILTTGGTGFGHRDVTPEALGPLIERPAPGLVHLLISSSLLQTPMAALSRPVAGSFNNSLIISLPGSVKAVTENLHALLNDGVILHALDLLAGGSGRAVHQQLAAAGPSVFPAQSLVTREVLGTGGGHHHHSHQHQHHGHSTPIPRSFLSHDPSKSASTRHRNSPYPQISVDEALSLVKKLSPKLETVTSPLSLTLCGCILAENIYSDKNIPATLTTNVDGYALKSSLKPGQYKVLTSDTHRLVTSLPDRYIYRINTGGPLPTGADAVIMVEDTELVTVSADGEEMEVRTLAQLPPGENVRQPGSDVRQGDLILERGTLLASGGGEIGTLAFVGTREVRVHRKPKVALLSTGDELIDVGEPLASEDTSSFSGIYDTNRPSLIALLHGLGYETIDLGIAPDTVDAHVKMIQRGLREADMLVTTGGTSMGSSDLLKPVIERELSGTIHFGRVSVKPGKPTTFATTNFEGKDKIIFALPGNPASALVCFYVFVLPALRSMGGWSWSRSQLPRVKVKIMEAMRLDPRPEYHRVIISRQGSELVAHSTGGQRSSRVASLAGANGLVQLPALASTSGQKMIPVGSMVDAIIIAEIL